MPPHASAATEARGNRSFVIFSLFIGKSDESGVTSFPYHKRTADGKLHLPARGKVKVRLAGIGCRVWGVKDRFYFIPLILTFSPKGRRDPNM
jgi:hypothetical protein